MPIEPTIPPELTLIIAEYKACTTKAQVNALRKSLNPSQLAALDKWISQLPKATKPHAPKEKTGLLKDFLEWTDPLGRSSRADQLTDYIMTHSLTTEQENALKQQVEEHDKRAEEQERKEKKEEAPPPPKPPEKELILKPTLFPKWWRDESIAKIHFTSPGSLQVVGATQDFLLFISTIALTVSGEADVVFTFGSAGASGPMDFGGDGEPKGIVIAMGNSPANCGSGFFMISASSDELVNIAGWCSYYLWNKQIAQKAGFP